jgi:hypothetical protein
MAVSELFCMTAACCNWHSSSVSVDTGHSDVDPALSRHNRALGFFYFIGPRDPHCLHIFFLRDSPASPAGGDESR